MIDENYDILEELDHLRHVSAVRASKIAKLKKQLKEAEQLIMSGAIINSYSESVTHKRKCEEYLAKYKTNE